MCFYSTQLVPQEGKNLEGTSWYHVERQDSTLYKRPCFTATWSTHVLLLTLTSYIPHPPSQSLHFYVARVVHCNPTNIRTTVQRPALLGLLQKACSKHCQFLPVWSSWPELLFFLAVTESSIISNIKNSSPTQLLEFLETTVLNK